METKICKKCGRELPIEKFKKTRWGSYASTCNDCVKSAVQKTKRENTDNAKSLRLQDFTSRELMLELKRRGYDGKLEYVEKHIINLKDID